MSNKLETIDTDSLVTATGGRGVWGGGAFNHGLGGLGLLPFGGLGGFGAAAANAQNQQMNDMMMCCALAPALAARRSPPPPPGY